MERIYEPIELEEHYIITEAEREYFAEQWRRAMSIKCDVCGDFVVEDNCVFVKKPAGEVKDKFYDKEKWDLCVPCSRHIANHLRHRAMEIAEKDKKIETLMKEEGDEIDRREREVS